MTRSVPAEILTGCPELDLVWRHYGQHIVTEPGILIPDTDDDLTWHAFLGHSIDMQGFRAAEFAGIEPLSRPAPKFKPLRTLRIGVPELAALWYIEPIQRHLIHGVRGAPLEASLEVLRTHGGQNGSSLADAFEAFPWRKGHWSVRALLQNSAALEPHRYSFREWLAHACAELGVEEFPPRDFRAPAAGGSPVAGATVEEALRGRVERAFYQVGPALSAYMLCDWQLWLWNEGLTDVFAMYKQDSFHDDFVRRYGRGIMPTDQPGFATWWLTLHPQLPPRLASECIWLGMEHNIEGLAGRSETTTTV